MILKFPDGLELNLLEGIVNITARGCRMYGFDVDGNEYEINFYTFKVEKLFTKAKEA